MARSYSEQLDAVDAAIEAIEEGAQEYYIGSRRVRKADIGKLYAEREKLQQRVDAGTIGFATVAQFETPT
jgi:hypothetical protein